MKKGLKEKHMEVELNRLNTMLELKKGDTEEREKTEKELHRYKEERIAFSKRQQDLTEEVIAWRELLEAKDEEIEILNQKLNNLKRQKEDINSLSSMQRNNLKKDAISVEGGGKSATCSSNDWVIF